jgi:ATP-dependent DNA helicase DinG
VIAPRAPAAPLDPAEVRAALAPGGDLASAHPRYEDRPEQRELAVLVAESYADGGQTIAEAGTGTGKSVAYLLPAVLWAERTGERTVVSTNTIHLQEQLVRKDLPLLEEALGREIRYALVKGRQNYVSIRRARQAAAAAASLFEEPRQREIEQIARWAMESDDGSLSDLSFVPSADVWDEVASESDVCLRQRCPHFEACHFQRARREANAASVLVVNHHLLLVDVAVRQAQGGGEAGGVLPSYERLVLDEAHNLEDVAARHLGARITRRGFVRLLQRLEHRGRGVLPAVLRAVARESDDLVGAAATEAAEKKLRPALGLALQAGDALFALVEQVVPAGAERAFRLEGDFPQHPVWAAGLTEALDALGIALKELALAAAELRARLRVDRRLAEALEGEILELESIFTRAVGSAEAFTRVLRPEPDAESVRWIELRQGRPGTPPNVTLVAAPLDVAGALRGALYPRLQTLLLTSATLTTGSSFAFIRDRLGLDDPGVREAVHASPFDFATQTLLLLPTDIPDPVSLSAAHHDATARVVQELTAASGGGLFGLFTSHGALRAVAERLRRQRFDRRHTLLVQGEAPRRALLEAFTADGSAILLGTSSFWEGVDVPGTALRGLVIPRLPFRVPTEPLTAARTEALVAQGRDAFDEYMLPDAALRLKQGFGRLVRSRDDRGVVALLDPRVARRSYGRYLLASLPPAPRLRAPWEALSERARRFYAGDPIHDDE